MRTAAVRPRADVPAGDLTYGGPMTSPLRVPPAGPEGRRRGRALAVSLLGAVGVWLVWHAFVGTGRGQLVDHVAFEGSYYGRTTLWSLAEPVLEIVSVPFIAAVLVGSMVLAVVRRRPLLALQVALVVGGANLSTQLLKNVVLGRPEMYVGLDFNTLPSGHTTAAASVSVALLFVVPRRLRPTVAVLGAAYTVATGVSTLVGRWHRPSDVAAAALVVLFWAGVACAIGRTVEAAPDPGEADALRRHRGHRRAHVVVAGVLGLGALASGAVAAALLVRTLGRLHEIDTEAGSVTAYAGGAMGVTAVVCLTFALTLLLLTPARARAATSTPAAGPAPRSALRAPADRAADQTGGRDVAARARS